MKTKIIQLVLLSSMTFSLSAQAQSDTPRVAKNAVFSAREEIDYDGPLTSIWFPWGFSIRRYPNYTGATLAGLPTNVSCVHFNINYSKPYHGEFAMPEAENYNCAYSVIKLDFTKREIVVLIDLYKSLKPQARYLAAISGKQTDFFAPLNEKPSELTSKMTTLNEVLTRLTTLNTKFAQKRHMNGNVSIRRIGEMLWNPRNLDSVGSLGQHGYGSALPLPNGGKLLIGVGDRNVELTLRSSPEQAAAHESAQPLFEALSKTLGIMKNGYDRLREASDEESQDVFRKEIQDHVGEIRQELKSVIVAMNSVHTEQRKSIHLMEMVWFVNEVSALVTAVDAILLDQYGKGPAFTEILKQN